MLDSLFLGCHDKETLRRPLTTSLWKGYIFVETLTGTEEVCQALGFVLLVW